MATKKAPLVLIVDDNKPHCYVLARMLEQAGYSAVQAHTGNDALKVAARKPALLLLDVNLPDLNGFEVARRLQRSPSTASIPVVFMSATDVSAPGKIHDEQVKASGFLTQPVEQNHLLAVVEGALSRSTGVQNEKKKPRRRG